MRSRMRGAVGAGGENPLATRLYSDPKLPTVYSTNDVSLGLTREGRLGVVMVCLALFR